MEKDLKFFNKDISADTWNHRAELKWISKAAKELDLSSKISGNKIIVEGQNYASNEVDLLPTRILHSGAQEKWVQGGLSFRGEKLVFSKFFAKPFMIDGCKYLSVEQFLQYSKVIYFDDSALARKIPMTSNTFKIQTLGDRISPRGEEFDDWIKYRTVLLHTGMYAKSS